MIGEHSSMLDKIVYPDHRRFLCPSDVLRRDTTNFPHKTTNFTLPPLLKTTEFIHEANKAYVKESDHNVVLYSSLDVKDHML